MCLNYHRLLVITKILNTVLGIKVIGIYKAQILFYKNSIFITHRKKYNLSIKSCFLNFDSRAINGGVKLSMGTGLVEFLKAGLDQTTKNCLPWLDWLRNNFNLENLRLK